jgi:hypothetical protein
MFLRKNLENLNLVIPHWVVILNETFVSANGSSINKSGTMALVSLLGRGHIATNTGILLCIMEHKMDLFGGENLIFVSGTKLGDYHNTMYGENLEELSLTVMDNASY